MARKQSRRSVSLRRDVHASLLALSNASGVALSRFIEEHLQPLHGIDLGARVHVGHKLGAARRYGHEVAVAHPTAPTTTPTPVEAPQSEAPAPTPALVVAPVVAPPAPAPPSPSLDAATWRAKGLFANPKPTAATVSANAPREGAPVGSYVERRTNARTVITPRRPYSPF